MSIFILLNFTGLKFFTSEMVPGYKAKIMYAMAITMTTPELKLVTHRGPIVKICMAMMREMDINMLVRTIPMTGDFLTRRVLVLLDKWTRDASTINIRIVVSCMICFGGTEAPSSSSIHYLFHFCFHYF